MSLPSGYTRLEYIESTGTQYIDAGFKADVNTRCVIDAQLSPEQIENTYGVWVLFGNYDFDKFAAILNASTKRYGTVRLTRTRLFSTACVGNDRMQLDYNKSQATIKINGIEEQIDAYNAASLQADTNIFIFAGNVNDEPAAHTVMKVYSCQIYDNDVLIRDFVPCLAPSGTAGLYDLANGVFYGAAAGDPLIAGPILILIPDPPGNLSAESDNGTNTLTWDESENADGYRVYENGVLIADTQQTSLSAASEPYSVNIYSVTAYNEDGESEPAVIRVYTSGSRDVLDDLITDRTLLDVTMRTKKGVYNAYDVNRVSTAAHRVRTVLAPLGYLTPEVSDYRWAVNEIPRAEEMAAHHASVIGQDVINYAQNKVVLPLSLFRLTHEGANNIEKFLRLCGEAAERIPEAYIYSDEIHGGENY